MTSITSCKDIEGQRDNMSLLDWLQPYISSDSVHQLSQTCTKGLQQYNEEMMSNIQTLLTNLETNFGNKAMRSIGGISARFSGLEKLLNDVDQIVQEQEDLTDAVYHYSPSPITDDDSSTQVNLWDSHHLIMMQTNNKKIRDIKRNIGRAKEELIQCIYGRWKWVHQIECQTSELSEHVEKISSEFKTFKEKLRLLQQIHYGQNLRANEITRQQRWVYAEEVGRRQNFQALLGGHILNDLFPGLEDVPSSFATQAPELFDTKLPKVEEVTAIGKSLESPASGSCYSVPTMERGFESETDSDKFEKVCQSPADMALDSAQDHSLRQLHQTKEKVQKSIVTVRNDLSSMKACLQREHNHVHSLLQQLTSAYRSEVDLKDQHIHKLEQEAARQEKELEDLQNLLAQSREAETKEKEQREQVEAGRDLSVHEATDQLLLDHSQKMAAAQTRFRILATATSMSAALLSSVWGGWISGE
ncbi:reticulophagy, variant 2 [Homalodisca vitripennis]|nr:reticulophagy, variant 2 [Homalodisca vitripennis]